jgi:septum formation protein
MRHHYSLILASGSPRRREFLEFLGLPFTVVLPQSSPDPLPPGETKRGEIDETPLPGESPSELVQRLSRAKAQAVAAHLSSLPLPDSLSPRQGTQEQTAIIIAADTVVVLGDKILGKPANPFEATQMLKQLRQQQYHYVYSGLTVGAWRTGTRQEAYNRKAAKTDNPQPAEQSTILLTLITRLHESKVWMRPYSDAEIEAYVASGDPLDKAGAYAIQNKTFAPVERLEGCFASVMGLPLGELAATLRDVGLPLPTIGPLCSRYTGRPCCQQ